MAESFLVSKGTLRSQSGGLHCARVGARATGSRDDPITARDLERVRSRLSWRLCCENGGEENFGYVSPWLLAPYPPLKSNLA